MEELEGIIHDVVFRNEQNGYTVLEMEVEESLATVVGFFVNVNSGENIKVTGKWVQHPDYGEQFKAESYQVMQPATLLGIERYLASGIVEGIGPHIAKKMVEKYGMETLDIILYDYKKLTKIEGIGEKKAIKIYEAFQEQRDLKEIMIFLEQYGIGPTHAVKIYKTYGANTKNEIKANPYKLVEDIFGISFQMADKVAMSLGISESSEYRISSAVKYILNDFHGYGHTFMPEEKLINAVSQLLEISNPYIEDVLFKMFLDKSIVIEKNREINAVYSMAFYKAESGTAIRLMKLTKYLTPESDDELQAEIKRAEQEEGIELAENQRKAVREAIQNGVLVITGGPGTGKTTAIKTIIRLFTDRGFKVMLAAPTGRAAKRMQEATGKEAKTIHRLLEYGFGSDDQDMFFQKNEDSLLECDVIIVDEVSMMDILLMNSLLKAIAEGTKLILVGDVDQLSSVGPGNVLRDIIESNAISIVRLDEIFRQARQSMIVVNAHKINQGELPVLNEKEKDFFFVRKENQNEIAEAVVDLCRKRLPNYTKTNIFEGIQVISPMKKGMCGIQNLNNELQKQLNPFKAGKEEKKVGDTIYREGDKVMQIKNNYNIRWYVLNDFEKEGLGIFNGDMGMIQKIDNNNGYMDIIFDSEKLVKYDFSMLEELELAYALTVHKSQGSEFSVVVMPITYGPPMLMTRNLLYTALTRAKTLVVLVGSERYLAQMVANNFITKRFSGLLEKLEKYNETEVELC